ncbi:MAG: S26 family signal peptidase [Sulfurovum sp.]|nr:S26 family signal peptidase [Sulfurovum sp.]
MIRFFKVSGHSLFPLLRDGQRVFCLKVFPFSKLSISNIVIFDKAPHGLMIKQIKSIEKQEYFLQGTDPFSIDSRDFGTVNRSDIKYKMWFRF